MSEHTNNTQENLEQIVENTKDIQSKLSTTSGYLLSIGDSVVQKLEELKKQNKEHLYILKCKTNVHFYTLLIFHYLLFIITNFKEPCFLLLSLLIQTLQQIISLPLKLFMG